MKEQNLTLLRRLIETLTEKDYGASVSIGQHSGDIKSCLESVFDHFKTAQPVLQNFLINCAIESSAAERLTAQFVAELQADYYRIAAAKFTLLRDEEIEREVTLRLSAHEAIPHRTELIGLMRHNLPPRKSTRKKR